MKNNIMRPPLTTSQKVKVMSTC